MFPNTKIRWTIDAEKSEIFFKQRRVVLSGCHRLKHSIHNENSIDDITCRNQVFDKIQECNNNQESIDNGENIMYVTTNELCKKINYNLVVFEEKNCKQFWKRNSFKGLLIFNDHNKNVLLTLHKKGHSFDKNNSASATYIVKGELNKIDLDIDLYGSGESEAIVLNSVILFEGEIILVESEQTKI